MLSWLRSFVECIDIEGGHHDADEVIRRQFNTVEGTFNPREIRNWPNGCGRWVFSDVQVARAGGALARSRSVVDVTVEEQPVRGRSAPASRRLWTWFYFHRRPVGPKNRRRNDKLFDRVGHRSPRHTFVEPYWPVICAPRRRSAA